MRASHEPDGQTPLTLAAVGCHAGTCTLLINRGARIEHTRSKDGFTPLMCAAVNGGTAACAVLILNGADVKARTSKNYDVLNTPLKLAFYKGHASVCTCILSHSMILPKRIPEKIKRSRSIIKTTLLCLNRRYPGFPRDIRFMIVCRDAELLDHLITVLVERVRSAKGFPSAFINIVAEALTQFTLQELTVMVKEVLRFVYIYQNNIRRLLSPNTLEENFARLIRENILARRLHTDSERVEPPEEDESSCIIL